MPSCSTGWIWHCMARETGKLGHLYSPGAQRGPWPWFPFALDNGAFSLWEPKSNTFDESKWISHGVSDWRRMLFWAASHPQRPLWAIVPDRPGNWTETMKKWEIYAQEIFAEGIPLAVAVQDGATVNDVRNLYPQPELIAVGGSTEWKWGTAETWLTEFPRVHLLRVNSPDKLNWLQDRGCESCDGTGWNRGDRKQSKGLEDFVRGILHKTEHPLWPHMSRAQPKRQMTFA